MRVLLPLPLPPHFCPPLWRTRICTSAFEMLSDTNIQIVQEGPCRPRDKSGFLVATYFGSMTLGCSELCALKDWILDQHFSGAQAPFNNEFTLFTWAAMLQVGDTFKAQGL